ncbi:MAG: hypothetical protein JRE18_07355, partial [Deltaproteobacteria bacterium]|nr:hypothetical protein [Deltaproteobacteria bacterium]
MSTAKNNNMSTRTGEPNVFIELVTGKELATLRQPFQPDKNELEVILARNGKKRVYPLFEICCIQQKEDPNHNTILRNAHDLMEIETLSGTKHLVRIAKEQRFQKGFYGSYLDLDNPYKSVFFTHLGVKSSR